MTQLTDKYFAVEVPEDATNIVFHNDPPKLVFSSDIQDPAQCGGDMICLPPGTWRFLFTTKSATEEDARKVVAEAPWVNYMPQNLLDRDHKCWLGTALESLASLLRSKGLDTDKNYALIENEISDD